MTKFRIQIIIFLVNKLEDQNTSYFAQVTFIDPLRYFSLQTFNFT